MRITYIVKYIALLAGLDRVMSFKMNWLAAHGYEVSLITYEQRGHDFSFPLDPRIHHTDIDVKLWKKQGSNVLTRGLSYLRLRRLFRQRMRQAVAATQPDILICDTYSYQVMDILMSIPTSARRIIESHVERHGCSKLSDFRGRNPLLRGAAWLYDWYMTRYIRRADTLVCLTRQDAAQWPEVKDVRAITNPLTTTPQAFSDCSSVRAIAVGRFQYQKGFDLLIQAWQQVHVRLPQWRLDIYGDGDDRESLQRQIAEAGLTDVITLHPSTPDIFARYAESSIYVLSSRYEGYGLVLAEAMSCGVPCVAFDCPYGPSDIILDGDDGILVPPLRTNLLAEAIVRLASDTALRQTMGRRARTNIQRFAPEAVMPQWQQLFAGGNK